MSFRSLQHMQDTRVRFRQDSPSRRAPPSGFGYPLDGFIPRCPGRFCFTPAALLGFPFGAFSLREVDARFHAPEPTYRWPLRYFPAAAGAGPKYLGFWALTLPRVPCETPCFWHGSTGCSLGFHPSRVRQSQPRTGFRPSSLHVLTNRRTRRRPTHPKVSSADFSPDPPPS